jgi:hypothetical protein
MSSLTRAALLSDLEANTFSAPVQATLTRSYLVLISVRIDSPAANRTGSMPGIDTT